MDKSILAEYCNGGKLLRDAVAGIPPEIQDTKTSPGTWSVKELVIHMTDSDAISIDRMKRIITEDNPALLWVNEQAYIDRLCCKYQTMEDALDLFEINRRQFTRVLENLPEENFERIGTHNVSGVHTLGDFVNMYIGHLAHHLKILVLKREKLGV